MKNKIYFVLVLLVLVGIGFYVYSNYKTTPAEKPKTETVEFDYRDAVFDLDGQSSSLKDTRLKYFGNGVDADFDGDGRLDKAFIVTNNPGGSGTFYYVVAALNTEKGYVGSQGFLLGDRVAPQSTELGDKNVLMVTFADRKKSESFAVKPSVGKSVTLSLDSNTMRLVEIKANI